MRRIDIAAAPQHLEIPVSDQKGLQEVLLGPEVLLSHHPILRVMSGEENIVNVDNDYLLQRRQHFQKEEIYIATHADDMARVDEKNVPGLELGKEIWSDLFDFLANQLRQTGKSLFQHAVRVRLDRDELRGMPVGFIHETGSCRHIRRVSRSHFDDRSRREVPDHPMKHSG